MNRDIPNLILQGEIQLALKLIGDSIPTNNGTDALAAAAYIRDKELVDILISRGASLNLDKPDLIMSAARGGSLAIVSLFLRLGADARSKTASGVTTLMAASDNHFHEVPQVADLLIRSGAEVNAQNLRGDTVLILAAQAGQLELVKTLIAHGADVHVFNAAGYSALRRALWKGHREVARYLIQSGADANEKDPEGRNTWEWAKQKMRPDITQMLIDLCPLP